MLEFLLILNVLLLCIISVASLLYVYFSNLKGKQIRLSVMLESLPDGFFYVDKNRKVLVVNRAVKEMLGLSDKTNGIELSKALKKYINLDKKIEEAINTRSDLIVPEIRAGNKYLKIIFSPVRDNGNVLGVVVLLQDISEQKALNKMRQDFTSMMVHDLRAPLSVMMGTSDLLVKRFSKMSKTKVTELLYDIKSSSQNMLEIVNDLLDVAKIETGKFMAKKELGDIGSLIKNQVEFFRPLAERKALYIRTSLPENSIKINFDREAMSRVLANLISNAIKLTELGGITVSIKPVEKRNELKISISDTGYGITVEQKKHLFNKFEQMRNPVDPNQKGTGLGLVIAKEIIEAHGGKIWVESDGKTGSTFHFTLPL